MKKLYYLLPFLFLFTGCGETNHSHENDLVEIDLKEVIKHTPVDITLQDISNTIAEIPLETTDSSLINHISHLLYDGNQFYIMANNNVLIFNKKGARPNARGELVNQRDNVFKNMYQVLLKGETDRYLFLKIINLGGDVLYDRKEKTAALYKVKYKKNDLQYTIHTVENEYYLIGEYWDEETDDNPTLILATLNK